MNKYLIALSFAIISTNCKQSVSRQLHSTTKPILPKCYVEVIIYDDPARLSWNPADVYAKVGDQFFADDIIYQLSGHHDKRRVRFFQDPELKDRYKSDKSYPKLEDKACRIKEIIVNYETRNGNINIEYYDFVITLQPHNKAVEAIFVPREIGIASKPC